MRAIFVFLLLGTVQAAADDPCAPITQAHDRTYGFRPSKLSKEERENKVKQLDAFWDLVASKANGAECLRMLLSRDRNDGFFLFNGALLLHSLDSSNEGRKTVAEAALAANLGEVDAAGFVELALRLAREGEDITALAEKYMRYPDVDAYLPAHGGMKLDRKAGAVILYGSMAPGASNKSLAGLLSAPEPYARSAAAWMLAFQLDETAFKALKSLADTPGLEESTRQYVQQMLTVKQVEVEAKPRFSRQDVLRILRAIPHTKEEFDKISEQSAAGQDGDDEDNEPLYGIAGERDFLRSAVATLTPTDIEELREHRRRSIHGVSDESLYEYFAYTGLILDLINRFELYKEHRRPQEP
jgi:hypothetical protein